MNNFSTFLTPFSFPLIPFSSPPPLYDTNTVGEWKSSGLWSTHYSTTISLLVCLTVSILCCISYSDVDEPDIMSTTKRGGVYLNNSFPLGHRWKWHLSCFHVSADHLVFRPRTRKRHQTINNLSFSSERATNYLQGFTLDFIRVESLSRVFHFYVW